MASRIYRPNQCDLNDVKFSEVKKNKHGGQAVYVSYGSESRWVIQTPRMYTPFGMGSSKPEEGKKQTFNVQMSFGKEMTGRTKEFHDFVSNFDETMKKEGITNCKAWFKRATMSDEIAAEKYTPMLKKYRDPESGEYTQKYPDSIRFKLPQNPETGEWTFECFDENREPCDVATSLTKGAQAICLIMPQSVYFTNGKFGLTWRVVQMQVFTPSSIRGFSILPPEEESEEEGEAQAEAQAETQAEAQGVTETPQPETEAPSKEPAKEENSDETEAEKPKRGRGRKKA